MSSRREFFKRASLGVAGLAAGAFPRSAQATVQDGNALPAHRAVSVSGVHAYAGRESVAGGESITFHVSSTVPYQLVICRLGEQVDDPAGDEVLHEFPAANPQAHPIHPGSYIFVRKGFAEIGRALTLECWARPWKTSPAGLITQFDHPGNCAFGLFLAPDGALAFYLGDGGEFRPECAHVSETRLTPHRWQHLAATFDGQRKALWIDGRPAGVWPWAGLAAGNSAPLRLGAGSREGVAAEFFDGDLAMPVVYRRSLSFDEIQRRFQAQALVVPRDRDVLACWPLAEEQGDRVADASRFRRPGRIINHATWMIGGPSFNPEVPRHEAYDPKKDSRRGHGLRLASDDLYDCRWPVTHRYRMPVSAPPGIYVGRIRAQGWERLYHVTFIVRRARGRKRAPILVLAATNTWRAYSGTPFGAASPDLKQVWGTGGIRNSPGDPPAYCFYRGHAAGQGTFQLGLRMPWPAAGPYVLYGGRTDYSHLMRADRFAQAWLAEAGYPFDVVSDLDLHQDPGLLLGYRVFIINGHSEYWSIPMYGGLERYLNRGGNVICLSGNSLFWRVSFNDEGTIIECRKVDAPGDQMPKERRGECWHSQDGRRGGLMRECGFPGWKLVGLETLGWNNQDNPDQFGAYHVDQADHFLFHQPESVGLKPGAAFGQAPGGGLPRANGHEIDVRLSTLAALQREPAPAGAALPEDPPGMVRLANGVITWKIGGAAFDYFFRPVKPATDQGGEMIYWERTGGGRVFNAGSIGAGWALRADPAFQRLLKNVLFHFGVQPHLRA